MASVPYQGSVKGGLGAGVARRALNISDSSHDEKASEREDA